MLTGYFDDSGTHDQSQIVVWAGVFGNQYQWQLFDQLWAEKLKNPSPGKEPLTWFHMHDCERGENEFLHWKRHERDFLATELTEIICRCGLYGFSSSVVRKDWDELIQGAIRKDWGDAEEHCIKNCYSLVTEWAAYVGSSSEQLSLVFDNRPHKIPINQSIFDAFDKFQRAQSHRFKYDLIAHIAGPFRGRPNRELASLTFASVKKFRPLQAADIFAWESYRLALNMVKTGSEAASTINLKKLVATKRFVGAITTRLEIVEGVKKWMPLE